MRMLNPMNPQNAGAASAGVHNLKTYTDVTQLGLSAGAVTTAEVYDAMPNGSQLVISSNDITDNPTTYGTCVIVRHAATRGFARFLQSGGTDEYKMACNLGAGGLTGTWVSYG